MLIKGLTSPALSETPAYNISNDVGVVKVVCQLVSYFSRHSCVTAE